MKLLLKKKFVGPLGWELSILPSSSAIYVLVLKGQKNFQPLYIGIASNLKHRLENHLLSGLFSEVTKNIDDISIFYWEFNGGKRIEAEDCELKLRKKYLPTFNTLDLGIANQRTNTLISQLKDRENELIHREKKAYEREKDFRKQLDYQKIELDSYRKNLSNEQRNTEKLLSEERDERRHIQQMQEKENHERKIEFEKQMLQHSKEVENLRKKLKDEIVQKENSLEVSKLELEKEKKKYTEESRKNIEKKSNAYVNDALALLKGKEDTFHSISKLWSFIGGFSIVLGIVTLIYLSVQGFNLLQENENIGWSYVLLITFKGLIVVGLFIALAKYSFTFSQSYMHESVKNSERRHAINFGKFYLETYGVDAKWSEIKDAFEHWNIVSDSAFSKHDASVFDPKSIEGAVSLIEAVSKINPIKNAEKK